MVAKIAVNSQKRADDEAGNADAVAQHLAEQAKPLAVIKHQGEEDDEPEPDGPEPGDDAENDAEKSDRFHHETLMRGLRNA